MPLKMWIGLECTHNRIQDTFHSQLEKSLHLQRTEEIKSFASLKAERIRYPCLWEIACPVSSEVYDWQCLDEKMAALKHAGLRPIAGLLHHGSGPIDTNLLDPEFPEKFAAYAKAFAQRYPWIKDFTPINEILTTARFSCLYGHWYPHKSTDADFVRALYNQCRAHILAVRAIRSVTPDAEIIVTDDLGRTQSTKPLEYQMHFENERRWLSFDFLFGRVDATHTLYNYLLTHLTREEIQWIKDNATTPDILGVNHYNLSNRFLDHRLELYPQHYWGGNGRDAYADVSAADTGQAESPSMKEILREAWDRYHCPMAITEVHIRGHRETQIRWLMEAWESARQLNEEGADIRAVTAWSLLGSFNWNVLCKHDVNFYESGVFDLNTASKKPRKTLIAEMVKSLAQEKTYTHPLIQEEKWKKHHLRVRYAPTQEHMSCPLLRSSAKPILITGGGGSLANAFARICSERNIPFYVLSKANLDIADASAVKKVFDQISPWAVINTAGYRHIDKAETETTLCFRSNVVGPQVLAEECKKRKIQFLTFSSGFVFDGNQSRSYTESDKTKPVNAYGRSKAAAESFILSSYPQALIIRSSAFFGPWDQNNFLAKCFRTLRSNQVFYAPRDISVSPTYLPDLVHASLDLLIDKESGIIHLVNEGKVSWYEFASYAHRLSGLSKYSFLVSCSQETFNFRATRPTNSSLTSEKVKILPGLESAIFNYLKTAEFA
ncbi:family 1 glycosylhydrolase [Bdellovibrio sp. HCB2-146]|uniref:family 1 glycosylhydrolase n=1 Tax=Bdellovibrio sp. HCB2-146 TaxID=3394362 RepID=UPI0039BCCE7D